MNLEQEYRMQEYQDLGRLGNKETIRLKRNIIYGNICVEKKVPVSLRHIYEFLKGNHVPGIPRIYECIPDEDVLIIIEEYIEGRTLETVIHESAIAELAAVKIALEICDILKALHHANPAIISRDLKAENVMISNDHKVWLVDFDIARTYQEGKKRDTVILGTAEYAAPEQFGFFQTDNRTDIYALGVLINYMMIRKFPVEEMVKGRMAEVVRRCTFLEPGRRYQTIEQVKENILRLYPQYKETKPEGHGKKYTLPGFRSNIFWKKIVAVLGYLFITEMSFSLELKGSYVELTPAMTFFEQTVIWVSQLLLVGVICNYRKWRDRIPIVNNQNIFVRIIGYAIIEFLLLIVAAFVCTIFELWIA